MTNRSFGLRPRQGAARTPIFRALRRAFGLASLANEKHSPPTNELVEMPVLPIVNRREFLRTAALAGAAIGAGSWMTGCATPKTGPNAPRIVVVGGGISGLNAAYKLRKRGWMADIYESSNRTGGRMYSVKDRLSPGLVTELGGEFVDSNHEEMLALAKELRLEWLDMQAPGEEKMITDAFYFDGQHHTEAQLVEAFRPLAERIKKDFDGMEEIVDFEHEGGAGELDKTSLADYLDKIGATGWVREVLDVAFVTEYGLDAGEQSALNMIFMISTDLSAGKLALFGDSDERYKIVGGNQRIVDELASRVRDQIHLDHQLVAVRPRDRGYTLVFKQGGRTVETAADFAILTLPFTMLREVDMQVELPAWKKKAINELGYGRNAKLMLGMKKRVWRDQGYAGNVFSDEPFQLAWDNSRLQEGTAGGLTCYTGGKATEDLATGSDQEQANKMLASLEKVFSGVQENFNGTSSRFMWPKHPHTKASYACYKPGQWTSIAGAEGRPVGNLFFAGEHCSYDFQGFMNGGAETGKLTAAAVRKAIRGWKAERPMAA